MLNLAFFAVARISRPRYGAREATALQSANKVGSSGSDAAGMVTANLRAASTRTIRALRTIRASTRRVAHATLPAGAAATGKNIKVYHCEVIFFNTSEHARDGPTPKSAILSLKNYFNMFIKVVTMRILTISSDNAS